MSFSVVGQVVLVLQVPLQVLALNPLQVPLQVPSQGLSQMLGCHWMAQPPPLPCAAASSRSTSFSSVVPLWRPYQDPN